uniref:aldose 1-epimerase n=1 Tax=uncultured Polaribacter sp. TaxID=174711 RepID=UPI0026213192|nr:aldose 1-epimerase [uncultured Polaribacter sp.]
MITLRNNNSLVKIDNGELVSFTVNCIEFIHQKGNKGWRKSDDEMFPIIGPTAKNNFRVHTKKGDAIQDQHGLLRELDYQLISNNEFTAIFKKDYKANTKINNSKFPEKSSEEFLTWPFDFSFEKHFKIENSELKIDFVILSEKEMPFMLGYHPAFLLSNTGKETFVSDHKIYTLQDVYKTGSNAFPILNTDTIVLKNIDKPHLEISTKGFNNFMLWTEVDNMVCIEPITQYTSYTDQKFSEKNMSLTSSKDIFSVTIKVL